MEHTLRITPDFFSGTLSGFFLYLPRINSKILFRYYFSNSNEIFFKNSRRNSKSYFKIFYVFFLFLNCPRISSELPLDIYEEFFQKLFWETMWRFLQYSSVGYPENLPDFHHKSLWRFRWIFSWDSSRNSPRNSFPVFF